jgi:hypothetical protein
LAFRFGLRHFCKISIGAVRGDVEVLRGSAAFFWVRGQGCGYQFEAVVDAGGYAMDGTDEASGAATYHAQAEAAGGG